jgi:hypothetical protein
LRDSNLEGGIRRGAAEGTQSGEMHSQGSGRIVQAQRSVLARGGYGRYSSGEFKQAFELRTRNVMLLLSLVIKYIIEIVKVES